MLNIKNFLYTPLLISFFALFLSACEQKNEYIAPPPPEVTVSKPAVQSVTNYLEFTGTTHSVGFAEIKARVPGTLISMHFVPGTHVEKGTLLFVIEPEPYQATLAAAQADLVSAQAELNRAEAELKRANKLIKKHNISVADHLKRKTERDVAKAVIGVKKSKVLSAKIQLSYTQVTAPISGRVSRNMIDIGNLVGEEEATLLTSITQYSPMYTYFHLNERDLLSFMAMRNKEAEKKGHNSDKESDKQLNIPLFMGLADEEGYPHEGTLDFGESKINTATGTIELRGVFANTQKPSRLVPGLFTRLRLPIDTIADALLIDERAIGSDQGGRYLLIIDKENKVEKRPITIGQRIEHRIVIKKGLKASDTVIINGLQRARPGSIVNPQSATEPTTAG